ncbi:HNH endonuclease [Marinigracilibium pacificum]|uniref:HNH endonuclease n=1 Tax=Marinigracilibium pacificum TaxID=2729599 RepID=A0A848J831_9BACT|nr:HNH endonuclease [Marinigracilibium pacificum]NMM50539.1 HNH endonuclease [Marinigracilibium pacificum]
MNQKVLLLNQDYSPLAVCTVNKAFILLFLDKAEMVREFAGEALHSVTRTFPKPAVVKLKRYINLPYKNVMLSRKNIFKRDDHKCQYCGKSSDLTVDHLVPKAKGGKTTWSNLVTACKRCNTVKGNSSPEEVGLELRRQPYRPNYLLFLRDYVGEQNKEWEDFFPKVSA